MVLFGMGLLLFDVQPLLIVLQQVSVNIFLPFRLWLQYKWLILRLNGLRLLLEHIFWLWLRWDQ